MKPKQTAKIATDILMTAILLLLMAHSLVGEAAHPWLGIGMFVLFVLSRHALTFPPIAGGQSWATTWPKG